MSGLSKMIVVLGVICLASAAGLSYVNDLTRAPIAEAMRRELLDAVEAVLPPFDNQPDADSVKFDDTLYYVGKAEEDVVGIAFEVSTMEGYGGLIRALVGVDPSGTVTGVRILQHLETPGLGAKADNPEFLAQFKGGSLNSAKWAVKKDGGDFDQITGATITPRALIKAIEEGLTRYAAVRYDVLAAEAGEGTE